MHILELVIEVVVGGLVSILLDRMLGTKAAVLGLCVCFLLLVWINWNAVRPLFSKSATGQPRVPSPVNSVNGLVTENNPAPLGTASLHTPTAQEVVDELLKRMGQKEPPPESPEEPFAVTVEYRMISGGGALNTGLYLRRTMAGQCTLIPIGTALYFRIKNLKPSKAFVTGYEVAEDIGTPWGRISRVNPKYGDLLFALKKGQTPDAGAIGGTIPLPNLSNHLLEMNVLMGEVDFTQAELLTGDFLDDKIGPTPIAASDTVRGWAFFESNWAVKGNLIITLVDEDGKMHSYKLPVPSYLDTKAPNIMPHTFIIKAFADVSKCPIQPTVPQWPLPPNWAPPY